MASLKVSKFTVTFILGILLLLSFQHVLATRLLDEDQILPSSNKNLIVQALQRGPVPPSAGNPCTNIPGRNRGRCIAEINVDVGGSGSFVANHAPPAFPDFVVKFGAASAGSN
ncbi:hypothetical protein CRYUN_Cryun08bG0029200 [Craigia yunnanensis]